MYISGVRNLSECDMGIHVTTDTSQDELVIILVIVRKGRCVQALSTFTHIQVQKTDLLDYGCFIGTLRTLITNDT
jgi:hypothetical protein